MTLERGTLLHKRYRIVEILGQGGMGSVYRAVDENLGVEVAVKENLFTTDEYARQFRLEAVILANLRHPNLPRVTDHFFIGEQGQYLVMDFIEGEDLRQRMERQGSIPEEEAILVGAAMCDALTYLHTRKPPIIHRDVKPGNVKITPEGHIFLVDFGLAKVVKGSQATTTGARAMTPGYSPPEQYGTARTDPRTDIYSLGATLYAALTGVIPEDGLARAMDNVELTSLRKHNPKVSRRLAAAIKKALAVRAEDRFQTTEGFKQALLFSSVKTQHLTGDIIVTPPPHVEEEPEEPPEKPVAAQPVRAPSKPPSRPRKKRRGSGCRAYSITFLFLLAASALVLFYLWPSLPASITAWFPIPVSTPTALPTSTADSPTETPLGVNLTPTPTITTTPTETPIPTATTPPTDTPTPTSTLPGGGYGQIAFASSRTGIPQVYLMNWDGSDIQHITNLPDGACQPNWSPDGTRLVFVSPCPKRKDTYPNSSLYLINADGSGLTPLPVVEGGDFDPAWSPDGSRVAFTSLRDGYPQIYVFNLEHNTTARLTETAKGVHACQPAWSPQGTQIIYMVKRYELPPQIWVMTDAGLGQNQLVRSGSEYWDFSPVWSPYGETIFFTQSQGSWLGWLMSIPYEERGSDGSRIRNGLYAGDADFSPDGLWLVFESSDGTNEDIYIMMADGRNRTRLTTDPASDFDPAWRPSAMP